MNVDDTCYWKQDEQKLNDMSRMDYTLPSDSHYRDDIILYKMGLNNQAQDAKTYIEEKQRNDESLRIANKK